MKRILISIILLLGVISSYGQTVSSLQMFNMYFSLASDAYKYENYESALFWYQKSLDYAISNFGENDILVATALSEIGKTQILLGEKDNGIKNLKECVRIGELPDNYNPATLMRLLSDLADGYSDCSQYDNALSIYNETLKELQKCKKCSVDNEIINFWHSGILKSIGETYFHMHQYVKAIDYFNESNEIINNCLFEDLSLLIDRRTQGQHDMFLGESNYQEVLHLIKDLNIQSLFESNIALCQYYVQNNSYNKAICHFDKAINIALQNKDIAFSSIDDELVVSLLSHTAQSKRGEYIDSLSAFRQQLAETFARYDNTRPDDLCRNMSLLYCNIAYEICKKLNEIELGTQYIYKHVEIYRECNILNLNYANAMHSCANWMQNVVGDVKSALDWHKKRVDTIASFTPLDVALFEDAFSSMLFCYGAEEGTKYLNEQSKGVFDANYVEVISIMDCWCDILKDMYCKYSQDYIDDLINRSAPTISFWSSSAYLATIVDKYRLLLRQGQKEDADKLFIEIQNLVKDSDMLFPTLMEIADILRSEAKYVEAKDMYQLVLLLILNSDEYYVKYKKELEHCQSMLANVLAVRLGDVERAYSILSVDIEVFKDCYSDISCYIFDHHTLGEIFETWCEHEKALTHAIVAYETYDNHRDTVDNNMISEQMLLESLGEKYMYVGDYEKSEEYLWASLEAYNKNNDSGYERDVLDIVWPRTIYAKMACLYDKKGELAKAMDIYEMVYTYDCKFLPEHVLESASYLANLYLLNSEYDQFERYWNIKTEAEMHMLNKAFIVMTGEEREMFLNTQSIHRHDLVSGYASKHKPYVNKFLYNTVLLSKGLLLNAEKSIYHIVYESKDVELIDAYCTYVNAVLTDDPDKYAYEKTLMYQYNRVISRPLIEIYDWEDLKDVINKKSIAIEFIESYDEIGEHLTALLLRKKWDSPKLIELCDSEELEKYYTKGHVVYQDLNSTNLYNLIWSKLEPYINEGDNVYFAPDGLLYQMNIEVLQDADGRRANEKWNLHRVSSTRELCMEKPKIEMSSAALYGGLIYDVTENDMLAQSRAYAKEQGEIATRGFVADSTMRAGWKYLPETKTEVEAIAQMCESHNVRAEIFSETSGNEESFKALSGKKTPIIHLATHGFFYKNEEVTKVPFFNVFNFDQMPQKPDNSLKRSGLILAGGQKAWLGETIPDSVEDGILLAEEIAAMDLTGTDLVVLSACETGLGEITSEGVFGLQRAFKKAGVQTIIMSLWGVNDLVASLFMRVFYQEWLSGKTKHEAFAIAQNTVRESYEGNDWAAFIMLD